MAERLTDADVLLEDLTPEQRGAVTTSATPLCIVAGAGSGKTRVLTRRIAWQAATGTVDPRRVLAVTFTRAPPASSDAAPVPSACATMSRPERSTRSPWQSCEPLEGLRPTGSRVA